MTDVNLTSEQILTLKHHGEDYKEWLASEKGKADKNIFNMNAISKKTYPEKTSVK